MQAADFCRISVEIREHAFRMRGTLRPERVKGKNMKKYSKIARIAAFALAVVMLFAFAGCSGKKDNNNKNNGGSGENRTAPSNTPIS